MATKISSIEGRLQFSLTDIQQKNVKHTYVQNSIAKFKEIGFR